MKMCLMPVPTGSQSHPFKPCENECMEDKDTCEEHSKVYPTQLDGRVDAGT